MGWWVSGFNMLLKTDHFDDVNQQLQVYLEAMVEGLNHRWVEVYLVRFKAFVGGIYQSLRPVRVDLVSGRGGADA